MDASKGKVPAFADGLAMVPYFYGKVPFLNRKTWRRGEVKAKSMAGILLLYT